MTETEDADPKHAGYASGSAVIDHATWTSAVEKLLGAVESRDEEVTTVDERGQQRRIQVQRVVHETDPPEHGQWTRRQPRPGQLPILVLESEIAKGAKTLVHDHTVLLGDSPDLDAVLYHQARVVVFECRREHAKGLALREPVLGEGSVVFSVVLVK